MIDNQRNQEHAITREREPKGPQLNLSGWKSMREKLIESERHHLGGRRSRVTRTLADTAPLDLDVEEGADYRPASPSEFERQRADTL